MIADTRVRQGLIPNRGNAAINPSLITEAMRPSIVTQHLEHEIKKRRKEKLKRI